jgi:hypothetical protein
MKHIVGEHGEIHKHRHNFVKKHNISGRIKPIVQICPELMEKRHNELVAYLKTHKSPYIQPDLSYLSDEERYAEVGIEYNKKDLASRCPECKKLIEMYG